MVFDISEGWNRPHSDPHDHDSRRQEAERTSKVLSSEFPGRKMRKERHRFSGQRPRDDEAGFLESKSSDYISSCHGKSGHDRRSSCAVRQYVRGLGRAVVSVGTSPQRSLIQHAVMDRWACATRAGTCWDLRPSDVTYY